MLFTAQASILDMCKDCGSSTRQMQQAIVVADELMTLVV